MRHQAAAACVVIWLLGLCLYNAIILSTYYIVRSLLCATCVWVGESTDRRPVTLTPDLDQYQDRCVL